MVDFNALIQQEVQSQHEDRGEWSGSLGGQDVTIYAKPLCAADHEYVAKRGHRDFLVNPTIAGMVEMLARKAEDENGNKIFKPNRDVPVLKRLGQDKIGDIFRSLFGDQVEPETADQFEERVGN